MSTTTIRLENPLRKRVRAAAVHTGTSPHSFMLAAIEEKTRHIETQRDFYAEADRRMAEFRKTGKAIPWEAMRTYLRKRVRGIPASAPRARKIAG